MIVHKTSSRPQVENITSKQKTYLETILNQISGDCQTLYPMMLKDLLVLVAESDWALSIYMMWSTSNLLRNIVKRHNHVMFHWIGSNLDEDLLAGIGDCLELWFSTNRSSSTFLAHHQTQFLAFLDHFENMKSNSQLLKILSQLCFSPHLEVSKVTLTALSKRTKSDSETRDFLRALKVPSTSTESSSELLPFATRLCSTLAAHVSQLKSLFTESSDSTSALCTPSPTVPDESPLHTGNTMLEILHEGISLLNSLKISSDFYGLIISEIILVDCGFVPFLISTIIACLDLLDQQTTTVKCPPADRTDLLIKVLHNSWDGAADTLLTSGANLLPLHANQHLSSGNDPPSHKLSLSPDSSPSGRESGSTSDPRIQADDSSHAIRLVPRLYAHCHRPSGC
ncbi:hypothetical protein BLNAU_23046 [Blattamonas nauphoetae]|uniref:Uncharacterized protein n=1 Tax=Blattamonas nauphoetae TaxID=2049346 RepID=A0ABQ9WRB3_9EUKA|nr:hypothetical protein BLNAU_23046 [Blattamonas nauphoetae]